MAKINNNLITEGFTGMLGKQVVFKKRLGTRYAAAPPTINENSKPTAAQQLNRDKHARSTDYAKGAIKDPDIKAMYQAVAIGGQSAYNVAWLDARHAPKVSAIVTNAYKGNTGDIIFVEASDNFKVTAVKVSIYAGDALIEEGNAIVTPGNLLWVYTATVANASASKIVATAFDLANNEGVMEVFL